MISKRLLFFDIYLPSTRNWGYSDVELRHVQVFQAIRWFDTRVVEALEQRQDVANAGEIDVMLAGERLDGLQLHHVATRVAPAIGHGPPRLHHAQVLVHHQSPRVHLEDLGSHAQREDWLVEIYPIRLGSRGGGRDRFALPELHFFLGGWDYMVSATAGLTLGDRGGCRFAAILDPNWLRGKVFLLSIAEKTPAIEASI